MAQRVVHPTAAKPPAPDERTVRPLGPVSSSASTWMRVFGSSLGALLGLVLVSRHPSAARLLVAHEPPATELLPAAERDQAVKAQIEVEEVHRSEGIAAAMRQFGAVAGVDFADREPEVEIPQPKPERIANLEFFLTHDAPRGRARPPSPGLRAGAGDRASASSGRVPRRTLCLRVAPAVVCSSAARTPHHQHADRTMKEGMGYEPAWRPFYGASGPCAGQARIKAPRSPGSYRLCESIGRPSRSANGVPLGSCSWKTSSISRTQFS